MTVSLRLARCSAVGMLRVPIIDGLDGKHFIVSSSEMVLDGNENGGNVFLQGVRKTHCFTI